MRHNLAQLNVARFRRPMSDPVNGDFVAALDHVNALADRQPGFVWRLRGQGDDEADRQAFDAHVLVNMSLWTDLDALVSFVYREPAHRDIMRRRREWFERMDLFVVLWWVPAGQTPSVAEGRRRLDLLGRSGATDQAFGFSHPFGPPDEGPAPLGKTDAPEPNWSDAEERGSGRRPEARVRR